MKKIMLSLLIITAVYVVLYFIASTLNLVVFMVLLFVFPIVVNSRILWAIRKENKKYRIFYSVFMFSILTAGAYAVFAFMFEKSTYFLEFISNNTTNVSGAIQIEISDDFFNFGQIFTVFFINFAVLILGEFRRSKKQSDAYALTIEEYIKEMDKFAEHIDEVHSVGGLHPDWDVEFGGKLKGAAGVIIVLMGNNDAINLTGL